MDCSNATQNFTWPSWGRRTRFRKPRPNYVNCTRMCNAISTLYAGSVDAPQPHKCATTILKNNQGKFVKLSRTLVWKLNLIVEDLQEGAVRGEGNVDIWKLNNYIALCFRHGNDLYLVTVDGNNLQLKKTTDVQQDIRNCSSSWFQKDNIGLGAGQYCIQTANSNSPAKYLVINERNRPRCWCITLSDRKASNSIFTTPPYRCNVEGCTGL